MMQYVIAELSTNWLFLILGTILLLMLTFGISELILFRPSAHAYIQTLCFSPDGQRLYGVGFSSKIEKFDEGWVWAWEASTGKLLWRQKMAGHAYAVELSPQSDSLLVVGFRKGLYSRFQAILRSLETGEVLFPLTEAQNNAPTGNVYFTPDGNRLLGCYKEGIQVWDAHTGERLDFWALPEDRDGQPTSLYFSADGNRLLVQVSTTEGMGGYAQVWDARAGAPVRDAQNGKPSPDFPLTQLSVCAISAEGEQVAIFYVDGTTARIELWSAQGQLLKTVAEVPRKILPVSISFQPDGNLLYKFDDSSPSRGLGGLPITRTFLWDVGSDQITEQTRDYERFLFPSPEGSLEANIRLSAICHAGTMEPVCFLQGLTGR